MNSDTSPERESYEEYARKANAGCVASGTLSGIDQNGSLAKLSGSSSAVERQLPKLDVAGSIPVSRSINLAGVSQRLQFFFADSWPRIDLHSRPLQTKLDLGGNQRRLLACSAAA